MVYDSAVEAGLKERYLSISSFYQEAQKEPSLWGQCWQGFFVHGQLHLTYYIMIATSIIVLFLIWMLERTKCQGRKADSVTMKQIIWTVKDELKRNPMAFKLDDFISDCRSTHVHVFILLSKSVPRFK